MSAIARALNNLVDAIKDLVRGLSELVREFMQTFRNHETDSHEDTCTAIDRCAICRAEAAVTGSPFSGNPMGQSTHHDGCGGRLATLTDHIVMCVDCGQGWPAPDPNRGFDTAKQDLILGGNSNNTWDTDDINDFMKNHSQKT